MNLAFGGMSMGKNTSCVFPRTDLATCVSKTTPLVIDNQQQEEVSFSRMYQFVRGTTLPNGYFTVKQFDSQTQSYVPTNSTFDSIMDALMEGYNPGLCTDGVIRTVKGPIRFEYQI